MHANGVQIVLTCVPVLSRSSAKLIQTEPKWAKCDLRPACAKCFRSPSTSTSSTYSIDLCKPAFCCNAYLGSALVLQDFVHGWCIAPILCCPHALLGPQGSLCPIHRHLFPPHASTYQMCTRHTLSRPVEPRNASSPAVFAWLIRMETFTMCRYKRVWNCFKNMQCEVNGGLHAPGGVCKASCMLSLPPCKHGMRRTHPEKLVKSQGGPCPPVSAIKLIRTDTTLDLSQKAEKGMLACTRARCVGILALHVHACAVKALARHVAALVLRFTRDAHSGLTLHAARKSVLEGMYVYMLCH